MKAIGGILVFVGIIVGLYVGVWWAFIGGIIQIINAVKATPVEAMPVAIGIAKIVFSGTLGFIAGAVLCIPGMFLAQYK